MRVVYKRTMEEKLRDAIAEAELNGKEIRYIALTDDEASKLISEDATYFPSWASYRQLHGATFMGIPLKLESKL